ncbi:excalibur calcium-binding domain-containing protein [Streptomyces cavernicola]|uniref:Excalibur calcium-binding domain-containing protein n=1 Tax=Streptomyces cavernicola TaxID=3043613 RepID=A0ABT6S7U5_9ACTN|nr:excalibur calcium-binding domain-containing protein [Streptomyces sp. B-S-A6]MDI3404178.1 excalibur calcium-binding domain-containing protein [Streptomyces sp. B-S-A6]
MSRRTVRTGIPALLTAGAVAGVLALSGCDGDSGEGARPTVTETVTTAPTTPDAGPSPPERTTPAPSAPEPTTPAPPPPPPPPQPPPPHSAEPTLDSEGVVLAYFAAINVQDYRRAWDLGGRNLAESYTAFVDGFATTAHDDVRILGSDGSTVSIRLEATQTDGSVKVFEGTYDVRGGVIVGADVHEVPGAEPGPGSPSPYYPNCDAARSDGAAPLLEGRPGYAPHLDRDDDGVACEPYVDYEPSEP